MEVAAGTILEGTVVKITHYGAFVELPDGKSGLVHISEIADTYV
jgi:S1 RNA binding domain protein